MSELKYFEKFSLWSFLKTVQTNKIVSSTYVWLVIVPVFAKAFSAIESVKFEMSGVYYTIDLTLPFSWVIFFFSSLCFVIGNVIYVFSCSEFIKNYNDYGDFKSKGILISDLDNYCSQGGKSLDARIQELSINLSGGDTYNAFEELNNSSFWNVHKGQDVLHKKSRLSCLFFYTIGFGLFLFVAFTNLYWVISELIS